MQGMHFRFGQISCVPLLWRVFTTAAVHRYRWLLLAATPGAVHVPRTLIDVLALVAAVGRVLALNLALPRPVSASPRLARTMRDVDLLRPAHSAGAGGKL